MPHEATTDLDDVSRYHRATIAPWARRDAVLVCLTVFTRRWRVGPRGEP